MLDAYLGFIVFTVLIITALSVAAARYRSRAMLSLCVLGAVCGTLTVPAPVSALEIRRDDSVVTIPASETIDDTLVVAAETVIIEGNVTGDVIAVGATIDVSGAVGGNLAGGIFKNLSLGTLGNSLAGILGGGIGGQLLGMFGVAASEGAQSGTDITSILTNLGASGVGGGVLLAVVGLVKKVFTKG